MRRQLLIEPGAGEWRAAVVEDGDAVELHVERGDQVEVGSVHLGRVRQRVPGLAAMLVDIGGERPGFLPFGEIAPGGRRLDEGERVVVRVRRAAQGGKAPRLTMALGPEAASWQQRAVGREPPCRLDPAPGPAERLARVMPAAADEILVDDPGAVPELRRAFAGAVVVARPQSEWPAALDALTDEALAPSLPVGAAGAVHWAATRAAVVIDVDTGTDPTATSAAAAALAVNLAAARLIARQLRLRNLGGGIVVDFVGLEQRGMRDRLRIAMAAAIADDPAGPRVLGWTRLGHLELVRPRRGRPLAEILLDADGRRSAATLAHAALRALRREAQARPGGAWRLRAAPEVAAVAAAMLPALAGRFALRVAVEPDPALAPERCEIIPG